MEVPRNRLVFEQSFELFTDQPQDIDENNVRTAEHNVKLNGLESRIQIVKTDPKGPLFPLDKFGQSR